MKKIYSYFAVIFLGLSASAFSDELKLGYGKFEKGSKYYENYMSEITYVYNNKDLLYGLTPIAGALKHQTAYMIYGGVQKKFKFKRFGLIPSVAPGYYEYGDEKNLGLEFQIKSQIEFTIDLINDYTLSYSWSHISNADLGNQNEGADNEMFFITKKF